jgi:hypothetical protein
MFFLPWRRWLLGSIVHVLPRYGIAYHLQLQPSSDVDEVGVIMGCNLDDDDRASAWFVNGKLTRIRLSTSEGC